MTTEAHATAQISPLAAIDISSRGTDTVVGAHSVIDAFVRIKHVGGSGHIRIGKNCHINSGCVLYSGNGINLGDDVLIGPNCSLVPVNHATDRHDVSIRLQGFTPSKGGITIESNVWLGAAVTVLDGVTIRSGCVVAANALVNSSLEQPGIYGGVPAKFIKGR